MPGVIGFGTGRCGSLSLRCLLKLQPNAIVGHEREWDRFKARGDLDYAIACARRYRDNGGERLFGDIGPYWFRYAWEISRQVPEVKLIALQRDRAATVNSWVRVLEADHTRGNPWCEPLPERNGDPDWAGCFPSLGIADIAVAAGVYWDTVAATIAWLKGHVSPDRLLLIAPEVLSTDEGQRTILDFLGVAVADQATWPKGFHRNKGT